MHQTISSGYAQTIAFPKSYLIYCSHNFFFQFTMSKITKTWVNSNDKLAQMRGWFCFSYSHTLTYRVTHFLLPIFESVGNKWFSNQYKMVLLSQHETSHIDWKIMHTDLETLIGTVRSVAVDNCHTKMGSRKWWPCSTMSMQWNNCTPFAFFSM